MTLAEYTVNIFAWMKASFKTTNQQYSMPVFCKEIKVQTMQFLYKNRDNGKRN